MQRDPQRLADSTFDLLVVGGGIYGAVVAWDAALRGLDVALIDRDDFGAATSANSLKIVHGGLRYLQQIDFARMRESIAERSTLLRIAPHLVRPLPFLVATHGRTKRSRAAMATALKLADAVGFDRNRKLPEASAIPPGRVVSRRECAELFPGFESDDVTGGAVWYDCQMRDSERLTLAFLLSAAERGAVLANYVEALRLLVRDARVEGARVLDRDSGAEFDVRARVVVDATGAWAATPLATTEGSFVTAPRSAMALAINLVCRRSIADVAVGLQTRTPPERDPVCGGGRYVFLTPWRNSTLIGTTYRPWHRGPDALDVDEPELRVLIDECNEACPALGLDLEDVSFHHRGLVPLKGEQERGRPEALADDARLVDHESIDGIGGLLSVSGVKYTTARSVAARAVDVVFRKLDRRPARCRTDVTPVLGGEPSDKPNDEVEARLLERHGSAARQLARQFATEPGWTDPLVAGEGTLAGEVLHAVRGESAIRLTDVVLRRTGMGTEWQPSQEAIAAAATLMARELGWSESRRRQEVDAVLDAYRPRVALEVRS